MSFFLYGKKLTQKIDEILSQDCICVVSYIGNGATKHLKKLKKRRGIKTKIICNFNSNGTNPYEVEELINYLGKNNIKKMEAFHAKVYFCSSGAIVSSANFSANGLELMGEPAKQLEAGIFVDKTEKAYQGIKEWCNKQYKKAKIISDLELRNRQKSWDEIKRNGGPKPPEKDTDELTRKLILDEKNKFGFMFFDEESKVDEKKDVVVGIDGQREIIKKYMHEENLYDWTEEASINELYKSKAKKNKGFFHDIIENIRKIDCFILIKAQEDRNGLPRGKTLSVKNELYSYTHYSPVKISKTGESTLLFFYKKIDKYQISSVFKKKLKIKIQDSLKNIYKKKLWEQWEQHREGRGWFMGINTFKQLIKL